MCAQLDVYVVSISHAHDPHTAISLRLGKTSCTTGSSYYKLFMGSLVFSSLRIRASAENKDQEL